MIAVLDPRIYDVIASAATAIALWAQHRKAAALDPIDDLTERLRHPVRWTIKHPLRALDRAMRPR